MGIFRHAGMKIVHQHPHWRLCHPAFGSQFAARRGVNIAGIFPINHINLLS